MGSATESGIDDEISEKPQRPESEQECAVSINMVEVDGEDFGEVFAHGEIVDATGSIKQRKVLLAHVSETELIMFPRVSASYRDEFLEPKYRKIRAIKIPGEWVVPDDIDEFDSLLEELPVGFSRHARRGLGLRYEYRLIVEAIETETAATELVLVDGDVASLSGATFILGRHRFERVRKALDLISRRSQQRALKDRRILAHNEIIHTANEARFPKKFRQPQAGEIFELVKLSSRDPRRNQHDRTAAADLIRCDAPEMAQETPKVLLELHSEIERVTLGVLIARFERLLKRNPTEPVWQEFFETNPFILSIAFPYPIMLVQGQAHVGGARIDGGGETIADFLFRQRLTGGIALFEIKTGRTPLLQRNSFRGNLYAAHKELCATISQVLHQRSELIENFQTKARSPGMEETHVGHVHCLIIAGRDPETPDKRRSLDLFRNATKDVALVTFDELLEKLRAIHRLMLTTDGKKTAVLPSTAAGEHT